MRGLPSLGRWIGLLMVCAGLGTVAVATPPTAAASVRREVADRPTAIAVAPNGTAYVGFAGGGKIQLLAPGTGKPKGTIELASSSPVAGLFVTSGGDLWVDQQSGITLLGPHGRRITGFEHRPQRECGGDAPAARYGGIVSVGTRVYVANRCHASISVYSRGGDLQATVNLPGRDYPRGIAYGPAQAGQPAKIYVAVPDRGVVLAYRAASLRRSSKPMHTYAVRRPAGGKRPAPGGVAVDKWGQLTVTDMANNALYLIDANNDYTLYRTLGHPPRAGREAGRLNYPSSLAQHDQDGGSMSGDLFVADTNNTRVQRWNTSGYTYWAKQVNAGSAGGSGGSGGSGGHGGHGGPKDPDDPDDPDDEGPTNTVRPSISGTAAVGEELTCNKGEWVSTGGPSAGATTYTYRWRRDGATITAATSATYPVVDADDGRALSCVVRATNNFGYNEATSPPVSVGDPDDPGGDGPVNTAPPTITGTPAVGQVLTCERGTWSSSGGPSAGSITYSYRWKRDGTAIASATAATYAVEAADAGTALTCTVTAQNNLGSTQATSAPVAVGAAGTGPVNTAPPTITGTRLPGEQLSCNPGTWSGSGITYTFVWRRDGSVVGTGTTYALLSADVGKSFTCTVTASFAGGSTTVTSAAVTVSGPSGHAPLNTTPPSVSPDGVVALGQQLTCDPGVWTGLPTFEFLWRRDGAVIDDATAASYTTVAADGGATLVCTVIASNGWGSGAADAPEVTVADAAPPSNTGPGTTSPSLSGSGDVGTALTCNRGTWTGTGISYRYSWNRDGVPVPDTGSDRYVVLSEDVGAGISCTVTARNSAGTTPRTTTTRTIAVVGGVPTPTAPPAITGTASVGQTLTCSPGTWTGAPTGLTTIWQRDGETVGVGTTHVVVAADQGATLRCLVVATNAAGRGAARSAPVGGGACEGAPGVVINDGDPETSSPDVQLTIRVPAGTTTIAISNSADMAGATTVPVSGTCTYPWTMSSIPGLPLSWSVYVQFDGVGTPRSDSIVVDQPATLARVW